MRRSPRIDLTSLKKSLFIQCKNAFNLHSQYHICCWPGDERHQGICCHVIKLHMLLSRNIPAATLCNTLLTFDTLIHSKCVNSLGYSAIIWRDRYGSTPAGSGNGLLPDDTKPLPEEMLTYHQCAVWHSHKSNFTRCVYQLNP